VKINMQNLHHVQTCVLGGGVIGLAVARALSMAGHEVLILEKEDRIGSGTSSRNSEVIHAGIYYAAGSMKANLCVKGKHMLYDYCRERHIQHHPIGKLIVATNENQMKREIPQLIKHAMRNNVNDLVILSGNEVTTNYEPEVKCFGAIYSPSTGIIDSHAFMVSLLADAEQNGAILVTNTKVDNITINKSESKGNILVHTEEMTLSSDYVVNATGLNAGEIANMMYTSANITMTPHSRQYFAKGNYYRLEGKSPFSHLIYPVPSNGGLGVHATVDMNNSVRFGPDVEWIDANVRVEDIDYTVDKRRAESFYDEVKKYWPGLEDYSLQPDYAGIRPKLGHPSIPNTRLSEDFVIQGESEHGISGFINLMGIESPGLTSSMAIADEVVSILNTKI
jgi:L-2-hydroxyglutarate oxidase LhgO